METATPSACLAEGAEIASKYRLGTCLAAAGRQAVYETIYRGADAAIKVITCDTPQEASALAPRFVLAAQLPHEGLLSLYDYGYEGPHAWIVMERGEECLAEILERRTLDEDEARRLLDGIAPALEFLRDRQFALAQLTPSNVFACGDRIKLSPDRIVAASPESDAAQLGLLILEALTGSTDPTGIDSLRGPFREIAQSSRPEFTPIPEAEAVVQPRYRKYAGPAMGGVLAAAALCVLLIRGARESSTQPSPVSAPIAQTAPAAQPAVEIPQAPAGWAMVGGSFDNAADALKRVDEFRKEHSRLDAQVFRSHQRFVVLFASGLTEAQAKKQLARVRRAGAPKTTSISRFE
jgi:hypothetical protein